MKKSNILLAVAALLFCDSINQAEDKEKIPRQLEDLKFRYEVEASKVLDPLQKNYIKALDELLRRYTEAGDLEGVTKTREEIARARMWETLPIETLRRQNLPKMDQEEFGIWLRGKQLDFSAKTGPTTMTFDEEQANWKRGGRAYSGTYKLTSNRQVTVQANSSSVFKIVFDEGLKAGTLESRLGEYDLKISDRK